MPLWHAPCGSLFVTLRRPTMLPDPLHPCRPRLLDSQRGHARSHAQALRVDPVLRIDAPGVDALTRLRRRLQRTGRAALVADLPIALAAAASPA